MCKIFLVKILNLYTEKTSAKMKSQEEEEERGTGQIEEPTRLQFNSILDIGIKRRKNEHFRGSCKKVAGN